MQWWNEFVTWLQTIDGHRSVFLAAVIFVAVLIGVLISGLITSGSIRRLLNHQQRELKNNVIATLVDAAAEAAAWDTLPPAVRVQSDRASAQAETLLRLLPVKGAGVAANWAAHELEALKRPTPAGAEQTTVASIRDRLIEWRNKPGKAKKKFIADLERWSYRDTAKPALELAPASSASTSVKVPAATNTASADQKPTKATTPPEPAAPAAPAPVASSTATSTPPASIDSGANRTGTATAESKPTQPTTAETERLLADVDALEVRSSQKPVEEFEPVAGAPAAAAHPKRETAGSDPQGTL